MNGDIIRDGNIISIIGDLSDFHKLLSDIHVAIEKAEYKDMHLDFSKCTSAFPNSILALCAQVLRCRESGIGFTLTPPEDKKLGNLFRNANWNHLLDPHQFDPSSFKGYTSIPATQYKTPEDQHTAVNKIVNVILGAIPEMHRSDFAAFEWAINELTDNVLMHSESAIGGLVQVSTFQKGTKKVQFVVADAGIGIPASLKEGHSHISSDTEALEYAIKEGVTRDQTVGQGNGLFGSYQICSQSKGYFSVDSGHARLEGTTNKNFSVRNQNIPYSGTLVTATIGFSEPGLLREALRFNNRKYTPVDFVETEYEKSQDGNIHFKLLDQSSTFGSRVAGKPVRTKLTNLFRMHHGEKIYIDLEGIPIISSSFADEAFGKLFVEVGPVQFMSKFEFINVMETVQHLIDKAIAQRMSTGL